MRHLPNLLTLANLLCGCLAIVCVLNAQPFLYRLPDTGEPIAQWGWSYGVRQIQWGGLLIFLAAVFDLLDGFAARALKIFSSIGADLDSLADVVSFGVAPSAILYKLLWDCVSREPHMTDVDMLSLAPAFGIALFAALRLARFNVRPATGTGFTGMPTPAVGLFIAALAFADWDHPAAWIAWLLDSPHSRWIIYALIAVLCYLMVSNIRFLKLMPQRWVPAKLWPLALVITGTLAAIPFLNFGAIAVGFVLYILASLIAPGSRRAACSRRLVAEPNQTTF